MGLLRLSLFATIAALLSACGGVSDLKNTMRDDHVSLFDHAAFSVPQETLLTKDAILLEERVRDVLKAARGPSVGCGAMLDHPSMSGCSEGLLKGRWLGRLGIAGPVDPEAITPGVAAAHAQLAVVSTGAEALLSEQAQEVILLHRGYAEGALDEATVQTRLAEMRQSRHAVADALILAAERSGTAGTTLEKAHEDGQPELDFYIRAIRDIETRSLSLARALRADLV